MNTDPLTHSLRPSVLRRLRVFFLARRRMMFAVLCGVASYHLMPDTWRQATRLLVAWDLAAFLYIGLVVHLTYGSTVELCRKRAALNDEGDGIILIVTVFGAVASFAAILVELATIKSGNSPLAHLLLTGVTVALSWIFTHITFALHYANLYYKPHAGTEHGGLQFPGDAEPDYSDFMYQSFVIACAAQTADVNILTRPMRQVTMLQCIIAFVFNTAVLALSINIGASLISGN
jgi:uncharacterized membrane protein